MFRISILLRETLGKETLKLEAWSQHLKLANQIPSFQVEPGECTGKTDSGPLEVCFFLSILFHRFYCVIESYLCLISNS